MRSQVTFTVDHDECTDAFQEFVESTAREYASGDIVMVDWTVNVDVPPIDQCSHCQAVLVNEDCPNYGNGPSHL